MVSVTKVGLACQMWSHQYPHLHQFTHVNFPYGGLGGHNHCRNPDGDMTAWCLTGHDEPRWDYCILPTSPTPGVLSPGVMAVMDEALTAATSAR